MRCVGFFYVCSFRKSRLLIISHVFCAVRLVFVGLAVPDARHELGPCVSVLCNNNHVVCGLQTKSEDPNRQQEPEMKLGACRETSTLTQRSRYIQQQQHDDLRYWLLTGCSVEKRQTNLHGHSFSKDEKQLLIFGLKYFDALILMMLGFDKLTSVIHLIFTMLNRLYPENHTNRLS